MSLDEDSCMDIYSKRLKANVENHNVFRSQMPDLIRDAYGFDENSIEVIQSPVPYLKE